MTKRSLDQSGVAHIMAVVVLVVIAAVAGVGYYVYSQNKDKNNSSTTAQNANTDKAAGNLKAEVLMNDAKTKFESMNNKEFASIFRHQAGVWWVNAEGYAIVSDVSAVRIKSTLPYTETPSVLFESPSAQSFIGASTEIFKSNNLTQNQNSSSSSTSDGSLYDYAIAYEGRGVKCTATVGVDYYSDQGEDSDSSHSFFFACVDDEIYQKNEQLNVPLAKAFDKAPEHSMSKTEAVVGSQPINGFASAGYTSRAGGGARLVFKQENGEWKFITGGNGGAFDCSLMDNIGMPKEIVDVCYDEKLNDTRPVKN